MLKSGFFIKKFFFLSLWLFFMSACGLNLLGPNVYRSQSRSVGDYSPPDSEFFYVDLDVSAYESNDEKVPLYEINTTEKYGDSIFRDSPSNCEIEYFPYEEGEERHSTETIICILDVAEFEFTAKSFHIVYNFPAGMCEYTAVALPWHFNYPVFRGPVVEVCEDNPDTDAEESGYRCSDPNISTCSTSRCHEDENDLCPGGAGEPPCCVGGEKEDGTEWEPHPECFGGPGTISPQFPAFQGSEIEIHTRYITPLPEGGLRRTMSLEHLLSFNRKQGTTAPHANYLRRLDIPPEDLDTIGRSDLPVFLQSSDIYIYPPRWFFEFSCLDSAEEELHQIFLMIREWNTWKELKDFYDSQGAGETEDPDVEGREGRDCEYEERWSLGGDYARCNDNLDLDDYTSYPKVSYDRWDGDNAE